MHRNTEPVSASAATSMGASDGSRGLLICSFAVTSPTPPLCNGRHCRATGFSEHTWKFYNLRLGFPGGVLGTVGPMPKPELIEALPDLVLLVKRDGTPIAHGGG